MRDVVIIDAVRTPIGKVGGALSAVRPDDLLAHVLKALMERTGVDPALVDDVYAGCANQAGEDNRNVARMATLLAGFPTHVPGVTVNRLCASGLEALNQAAKAILVGEGEVFIGAGVESMSRAPWVIPKTERAYPVGNPSMYDTTLGWRFINPAMEALYPTMSMGQTAENIVEEMGISREDQDAFALESQHRAVTAIRDGTFVDEIVPVQVPRRKQAPLTVDTDEHPRYRMEEGGPVLATSMDKLAGLRPVFMKGGTVTAGNASGLNDGAAAALLMSADKARGLGLQPMARWVGSASAGVAPRVMGYGPVPATNKLLTRIGLDLADIGLVELNEAFAAQSLGVIRTLGLDPAITNVNGGAIALGHPLGCTGTRIMTTLLHEMKRRAPDTERPYYGLATLCIGVGQGVSTVVEWIGE